MGNDVGHNFRVASGKSSLAADLTGNPAIVEAVTGHKLSLKRVTFSAVANTNFIFQDADGTDLWVTDILARQNFTMEFAPRTLEAASGKAIHVDTDVSTAASVYIECWVTPD